MNIVPDTPLTPEASNLFNKIKPLIEAKLKQVNETPVSILVWGPDPHTSSLMAMFREGLRTELRLNGHAAFFSEELCEVSSPYSTRIQQLAHAQEFDMIVSFPCSVGAIGEAHDFAADRRINSKMLIFLNRQYINGYSGQSLNAISSLVSCQICYYNDESDLEIVRSTVNAEVQKIRELKYLLSGRY